MPRTIELLFDPHSIKSPDDLEKTLLGLATEAGENRELHERTNSTRWIRSLDENGQPIIYDEIYGNPGTDVRTLFSYNTVRDSKESIAGVKLAEAVLSMPDRTLIIWVSPPYLDSKSKEKEEGRISVAFVDTDSETNIRHAQKHDLIAPFSGSEAYSFASDLNEFCTEDNFPSTTEGLRSHVLIFSLPMSEESPWKFLAKYIPLPKSWETIESAETTARVKGTGDVAREVVAEVQHLFRSTNTPIEHAYAVMTTEKIMAQRGIGVNRLKLDCPLFTLIESYTFSSLTIGINGNIIMRTELSSDKWVPGKCTKCKKDKEETQCGYCKDCVKSGIEN